MNATNYEIQPGDMISEVRGAKGNDYQIVTISKPGLLGAADMEARGWSVYATIRRMKGRVERMAVVGRRQDGALVAAVI